MVQRETRTETVAPCKLCGEIGELQRSHVVPEFAYGPIYDEKHKIMAFEPLAPEKPWKIQKGLRELLLCRDCERSLNHSYEQRFKEYWFDQRPLAELEARDEAILTVPDPGRFKLFHLSVLLRADLASHRQWSEVNLGERHRSRLIEMVRSEDPGEAYEYPIVCCGIRRSPKDPSIWWDLVAPPNPGRMDGMRFYQFTFGGCGWMYYVSSHRLPLVETVALRPDGTMPVIKREWAAFKRYRPHVQ
jgi:hypothetical protein